MDIRELIFDLLLTFVMVVSTVFLIYRFWQDALIAVAAALMMLSLGGLFISLQLRIRELEKSIAGKDRALKVYFSDLSDRMDSRYDDTISQLNDVIEALSKRVYR